MYGWHGFSGGFMWVFWILSVAALIWFVFFVARGRNDAPPREKSALEILQARYARGEIDRDEFEQKKRDLNG